MSGWSPKEAIAMERRHVREGEERVARQEILTGELIEKGHYRIALASIKLLKSLRRSLELSRERLWDLEDRYGGQSRTKH
jgi:hypothetical protein